MAKNFSSECDDVLFSIEQFSEASVNEKKGNGNILQCNKSVKCYRCGKPGHIKKYCRVKRSKANVSCDDKEDD